MPGSVAEKARRFNSGKTAAVYAWIRGEYAPADAKQAEIEAAGGPLKAWWAELDAAPEPPAPLAVVVPGAASPAGIASEADALLAEVKAGRAFVSAIDGGDPGERIRHLERLTSMMVDLSRMRGVLMSERQILASPHWLTVEAHIVKALEAWPDAIRAVADALDLLRGEAGS